MSYNFGNLFLNTLETLNISPIDSEINITGNIGFTGEFDVSNGNVITSNYGDIKHSLKTMDHNGWIVMDGRPKGNLTATQQTNATALGFGTNIPDATDRILYNKGGLQSTGGNSEVTILQTHLPEYNLTSGSGSGTTSSDGLHQHRHHRFNTPGTNGFPNGYEDRDGPPAALYWRGPLSTSSTYTTTTAPAPSGPSAHTHSLSINDISVPSGGGGVTLSIVPKYLSVNVFVYLGL